MMTIALILLTLISILLFCAFVLSILNKNTLKRQSQERFEQLEREKRHYQNLYLKARQLWETEKMKNN